MGNLKTGKFNDKYWANNDLKSIYDWLGNKNITLDFKHTCAFAIASSHHSFWFFALLDNFSSALFWNEQASLHNFVNIAGYNLF